MTKEPHLHFLKEITVLIRQQTLAAKGRRVKSHGSKDQWQCWTPSPRDFKTQILVGYKNQKYIIHKDEILYITAAGDLCEVDEEMYCKRFQYNVFLACTVLIIENVLLAAN